MFGFGYLLVPLYDVACDVLGLNGKVGRNGPEAVAATADPSRTVTVEFTGHASTGLPWEFRPVTKRLEVHPGETITVNYYARNQANEPITGQAVPSVAPGRAAAHFKKIECFCFTEQKLAPHEARQMPVRFVVDPGLAPEVQTITLSYAFFNIDKVQAAKYGETPADPHEHDHSHGHPAVGGNG
jgi:cytochrome c oxidase assembly protein subunit 11